MRVTTNSWQARLAEIRKLAAILDDEAAGRPVDCGEAWRLAEALASHCPDIARTMRRVVERMSAGAAGLDTAA